MTKPNDLKLPRGLSYEPSRRRWRVRLYYKQTVIWRSYHTDADEALETLQTATRYRLKTYRDIKPKPKPKLPLSAVELLQCD